MRRYRLIFCLLIAAAQADAAGAQSVNAGIEAWRRGAYADAVAIWRPLAEAGDPDAQYDLGQAYRLGKGVPINLAAAQSWLERAADKDHVDAQSTLGLLLFDSGNRAGGLRWLKTAAQKGDARALLIYGTALFNGDGVQQDPVLAYAYVSRAAAQGLAPAKTTLAQMDQVLPVAQRKKGVAIALSMASAQDKAKKPADRPAAKPRIARSTKQLPAFATVPASGGWRIQLGAFSQRSSAEALFRKLAAGGALAGRKPFLIAVGNMTRLQAGPFESRAAAASACASLSARGQPCFPVSAK